MQMRIVVAIINENNNTSANKKLLELYGCVWDAYR